MDFRIYYRGVNGVIIEEDFTEDIGYNKNFAAATKSSITTLPTTWGLFELYSSGKVQQKATKLGVGQKQD